MHVPRSLTAPRCTSWHGSATRLSLDFFAGSLGCAWCLACIDARRTQFRAADWSVVGAHHLHPVYRLALRALRCDERCGRAILARLDMDRGGSRYFPRWTVR